MWLFRRVIASLRSRGSWCCGPGAPCHESAQTMRGGWIGVFWAALAEVWPTASEQRWWNHKMVNVRDRLPRKLQAPGKERLCEIVYAPSREKAEAGRDAFLAKFSKEHPKATDTLNRDWERMVAHYNFPITHWKHLRTTNTIERPFASARSRTPLPKALETSRGQRSSMETLAGCREALSKAKQPGEAGRGLAGSEVREWRTGGAYTDTDDGRCVLMNCHT